MFSQQPAVSAVTTLRKCADEGNTRLQKIELVIHSEDALKELIEVFKNNKFSINEIELKFSASLSLADRSRFIMEFIDALQYIEGIEKFILAASIKDYALNAFLKNKSILRLKELQITHEKEYDHSESFVNTKVLYETNLVNYLQENPALETLFIDDIDETMPAKNYPKLKAAMIKHPKLTTFKSNYFGINTKKGQLSNDDQIILAFCNKVMLDPVHVKATRAAEYNEAVSRFINVLPNLEETVRLRQQIHKNEDPWHCRLVMLDNSCQKWNKLKGQYQAYTHEEADHLLKKRSVANVVSQYLSLISNAAYLISEKKYAEYKDTLELFWDVKRVSLHKAIIDELAKDNPDFTAIIEDIGKERLSQKRIFDEKEAVKNHRAEVKDKYRSDIVPLDVDAIDQIRQVCQSYYDYLDTQIKSDSCDFKEKAIAKQGIISRALETLNSEEMDNQSKYTEVEKLLKDNQQTLGERRDSGLRTFVKGLAMFGITLFTLGIATYAGYRKLFVTRGEKLIEDVKSAGKLIPKS